jgi:hypothetical protein
LPLLLRQWTRVTKRLGLTTLKDKTEWHALILFDTLYCCSTCRNEINDRHRPFSNFLCDLYLGYHSGFMLSTERGSVYRFLRFCVYIRIGHVDLCINTGSMARPTSTVLRACVEHNEHFLKQKPLHAEHSISRHVYTTSCLLGDRKEVRNEISRPSEQRRSYFQRDLYSK